MALKLSDEDSKALNHLSDIDVNMEKYTLRHVLDKVQGDLCDELAYINHTARTGSGNGAFWISLPNNAGLYLAEKENKVLMQLVYPNSYQLADIPGGREAEADASLYPWLSDTNYKSQTHKVLEQVLDPAAYGVNNGSEFDKNKYDALVENGNVIGRKLLNLYVNLLLEEQVHRQAYGARPNQEY